MIDLLTVIERIQDKTKYTTSYNILQAQDILPNTQEQSELPIIYVGYATVDSKNPNIPLEYTIFNTNGEDLVQSFEIQTICNILEFREIWITLYNSLIGWNPIEEEIYHSGFTYSQGGKMGFSNERLFWVDIWKIGFPTNKVLI